MKIAFLCSSLEPGRDGVGDYTRRLATACTAQGHSCLLFALNDRHASDLKRENLSENCAAVRWPADQTWSKRNTEIHDHLEQFAPDWVSWQMVSYGYHAKGILGHGLIQLAAELRPWRTHVMLHELWIGLAREDTSWTRFVGASQRRALLSFLQAGKPALVHTSNQTYVAALARYGWHAAVLPLFSNIPVIPAPVQEQKDLIARHLPSSNGHGRLISVTFGTLHPQWDPVPAGRLLQITAARHGQKPMLLAIGRTGPHGPAILSRLVYTGVTVAATGEIDPASVSCLLQAADFGIAPHPCALIDKSGVVAAMLAHGLPVLLPRNDWQLRDGPTPARPTNPRLALLSDLSAENASAWLQRRQSPEDSFPLTVSQFLAELCFS